TGLEHIGRDGSDYFVSPSHDGQSVAYVSARTPCFNVPCIRVLDLATNQDRTYGTQDFLVQGAMAAWSPVEGLIAYSNGSSLNLVRSRSEEHTSELQSRGHLVCRLLLEKKNKKNTQHLMLPILV